MYNYVRVLYYLNNLLRHAYWDKERLLDYQNRQLRAVVKYAYDHSGFYHQKFRQSGIKPNDIKCVKDLNKLPIVKKSDLQNSFEHIISDEFNITSLIIQKTSGSSGQPLRVYLSEKEHEFRMAKMLRANISCGQKPRDKWLVITAPSHVNKQSGIRKFLGIYSPFSVSVFERQAAQISLIRSYKPNVLEGYSSSLVLLANEMKQRGMSLPAQCRLVIGGAELIDTTAREFVEKVFGVPFFDQYASNELEAMAWQCEVKGGYHVDADSVIMQFLDEDGEEVSPGETGEIVCTSLFNYAMPIIRYAIGDIGVFSDEQCSCKRVFPLMKMIEGRADSFISFPDGRLVSPIAIILCMRMFSLYDRLDRFRVIQKRKDTLEFILKLKDGEVGDNFFAALLEKHFDDKFFLKRSGVSVKVEFVDDIPLDKGGKLQSVVSNFKS